MQEDFFHLLNQRIMALSQKQVIDGIHKSLDMLNKKVLDFKFLKPELQNIPRLKADCAFFFVYDLFEPSNGA